MHYRWVGKDNTLPEGLSRRIRVGVGGRARVRAATPLGSGRRFGIHNVI